MTATTPIHPRRRGIAEVVLLDCFVIEGLGDRGRDFAMTGEPASIILGQYVVLSQLSFVQVSTPAPAPEVTLDWSTLGSSGV